PCPPPFLLSPGADRDGSSGSGARARLHGLHPCCAGRVGAVIGREGAAVFPVGNLSSPFPRETQRPFSCSCRTTLRSAGIRSVSGGPASPSDPRSERRASGSSRG